MDPQPQAPKKSSTSLVMWITLIIILIIVGAGAYIWWQKGQTNTNTANTAINTTNQNTNTALNANSAVNTNIVFNANTATNLNTAVSTNTTVNSNTNTAVDTSGWSIYSNEDYGFSIKRPDNWLWLGSQNGELITRFTSAQEEMSDMCQLNIYNRAVVMNNSTLKLNETLEVNISNTTATRNNYIDENGELEIFTILVETGKGIIGLEAKNGKVYIGGNTYDCLSLLEASIKSLKLL